LDAVVDFGAGARLLAVDDFEVVVLALGFGADFGLLGAFAAGVAGFLAAGFFAPALFVDAFLTDFDFWAS
jgi:hypothetical protein